MICDECNTNTTTTGIITEGVFKQLCRECMANTQRLNNVQSAQYHRDRQGEKHRRDLIQPYYKGKPNQEFIRAYPDIAEEQFSKEELEQYG